MPGRHRSWPFVVAVTLVATLTGTAAQAATSAATDLAPVTGRAASLHRVLMSCDGPGSVRLVVKTDGLDVVAWARGRNVEAGSAWKWQVSIQSATAGAAAVGRSVADDEGRWVSDRLKDHGHAAVVVKATASTPGQPACSGRYRVKRR